MNVLGLANSDMQTRTYALILEEVDGLKRRMPIVIGGFEAKAIATVLEKVTPKSPTIHDFFVGALEVFLIDLKEVVISDLLDGVFYATLFMDSGEEKKQVDARSSDAIALAIRAQCPIYTYDFILDEIGIIPDKDEVHSILPVKKKEKKITALKDYSLPQLNILLDQVLQKEDYESAAKIRDEIARKKEG